MIWILGFVFSFSFAQAQDCTQGLCIGQKFVALDRSVNSCEVTAFRYHDSLGYRSVEARCENGQIIESSAYGSAFQYRAQGCKQILKSRESICVGDQVTVKNESLQVIGIHRGELAKNFNLSAAFMVENTQHQRKIVWASEASKLGFCNRGLCVNDRILFSKTKSEHEEHGAFNECSGDEAAFGNSRRNKCNSGLSYAVVKEVFLDGTLAIIPEGRNNRVVYKPTHFALLKGCAQGLCIGQKVMTSNHRDARIAGLNIFKTQPSYILKFTDTGKLGDGWLKSDLTALTQP